MKVLYYAFVILAGCQANASQGTEQQPVPVRTTAAELIDPCCLPAMVEKPASHQNHCPAISCKTDQLWIIAGELSYFESHLFGVLVTFIEYAFDNALGCSLIQYGEIEYGFLEVAQVAEVQVEFGGCFLRRIVERANKFACIIHDTAKAGNLKQGNGSTHANCYTTDSDRYIREIHVAEMAAVVCHGKPKGAAA